MSYCRWSSNDFRCDLYIYGASDGITIHVAGRRHVFEPPPAVDERDVDAWVARQMEVARRVTVAPLVDIGLPFDGKDYHGLTEAEAAAKVRELIAAGYQCDVSIAEELEAESVGAPPSGTGEP